MQIFKIRLQGVWGPADSGRIVRVLAGQAAWNNFLSAMLACKDGLFRRRWRLRLARRCQCRRRLAVATSLALTSDQVVDQMLVGVRGDIKSWMTAMPHSPRPESWPRRAESGPGDSSSTRPAKQGRDDGAAVRNNPRMQRRHQVLRLSPVGWPPAATMNQYSDIGTWSKWGSGVAAVRDPGPATSPRSRLLGFIAAHPAAP